MNIETYFEENGITIKLSKDGRKLLASIISDGCPVKITSEGMLPKECPNNFYDKVTCKSCWNKWLNKFTEKE